jgi:transposase
VELNPENTKLIETLLLERDELYTEVSRLRNSGAGALDAARQKNAEYEAKIQEQEKLIKQLTDQLAWYRRKLWKPQSEKYIPKDPDQRTIDFDGLDTLPLEEALIKEAEKRNCHL